MRVLAVVAHADDEVLGPGGTLLRHVAEGDEVRVLIVCSLLNRTLRVTPERLADAEATAADAGWTLGFGLMATLDLDIADVTRLVESRIDGAELVYTHHLDLNRDHRTIHEAVKVATRPFASTVQALRSFETPSASEWGDPFIPNHFVAIDLEAKVALLDHYLAEMRPNPHPRSAGGIAAHADFYGRSVGLSAAEPFHTHWERR